MAGNLLRGETAAVLASVVLLAACDGGHHPATDVAGEAESFSVTYRRIPVDYFGPWPSSVGGGTYELAVSGLKISLESCPTGLDAWYTACADEIDLDGSPADGADLKDGHIVAMHGTLLAADGWDASSPLPAVTPANSGHVVLDIQRAAVGPVETVDAEHLRLEVLGQSVYVDATTIVAVPNLDDSLVGDLVTVSGFVAPGGRILATRIEPYAGAGPYLLRGILAESSPNHFAIGNTELDIASARRESFAGGAPLAGDPVLLFADALPMNGVLTATVLRRTAEVWEWSSDDPWGGIRGFVTAVRWTDDIDVEGYRLAPTIYQVNGSATPAVGNFVFAELRVGRVRVLAGTVNDNASHTVSGPIEAIDAASDEITVLGIPIVTTPATQIYHKNESTQDSTPLTFRDLSLGDAVTVTLGFRWPVNVAGSIARTDDVQRRIDAGWDYYIDDSGLYPVIVFDGRGILTDELTSATVCGDPVSLSYVATGQLRDERQLEMVVAPDTSPLLARELNFGCWY